MANWEEERKGVQWGWGAWDTQAAPPECKGSVSSGTVEGGGKTEGGGVGEEGAVGSRASAKEEQDKGGRRADAQRGGSSTVDAPSHPARAPRSHPAPSGTC